MPANVLPTGPIPNHLVPNGNQRNDAHDVIAQLDYTDLFRGPGTLHNGALVRVDMQGRIPGPPQMSNIQVQVNGINGNSTIAHANVSWTLATNDPANQRGVANKVISALNQSLDTQQSYRVTGTIP